jgi:hypothetical protein
MIKIKIDCTKIDKARLFPGKNGAKYLDAVLIESPNSQYGDDYMIVQDVTKEERAAGTKGAILGNAKIFQKRGPSQPQSKPAPAELPPVDAGQFDDVPFN